MDEYSVKSFRILDKSVVFTCLLLIGYGSCETLYMETYCDKELSFITQFVEQIRFELNDDGIYDRSAYPYTSDKTCETTIEAWISTYPKLMFYFEDLNLDCDDGHLEFYQGTSTKIRVKGLEMDICGDNKPDDVYAVDSRYFRVKYVPKKSMYKNDVFSIIITTYADDSCPSYAYKCHNSRCISKDIRCNGYDSCGDDSGCDLEVGAIVGIAIGGAAGLAIIVSLIICCICCAKKTGRTPGMVQGTFSTQVAYTASSPPGYSQAVYGVNQANFGANQAPYPGVNTVAGQQTAFPSQNYSSPAAFSGFSNQGT